jgi:hypothetical protein
VVGAAHTIPHDPQFIGSEVVSTQLPPHSVCPVGQTHVLPEHVAGAAHTFPQAPQFIGSEVVSTQLPPQSALPPGHRHTLPEHIVAGAAHTFPHAPQFIASLVVSVHAPPHAVSVPGHVQTPDAHAPVPPRHAVPLGAATSPHRPEIQAATSHSVVPWQSDGVEHAVPVLPSPPSGIPPSTCSQSPRLP